MDEASDGEQLEDSIISAEKAAKSNRGTRSEREDQLKKLLDDDDGKATYPLLCSAIQEEKNDKLITKKMMTKPKPTTPPPPKTKTPLLSNLPAKAANNQKIPLPPQRHMAVRDGEEGARS